MSPRRRRARALFGALLVASCLLASCTTVAPWQRGRLAHECMQIPVDPMEAAYYGHVELVREASSGGALAGGGGCGCN